ncbi:MAG TPA: DUF362 domain-containing protein [Polyangiaceae bacterium]|nr:DUF362 domain-containing protein [Polyangiaceae bacterium]
MKHLREDLPTEQAAATAAPSEQRRASPSCTRRQILLYGGMTTAVASVAGLGYWAFWDRTFGSRAAGMPDHRVTLPSTAPTIVVARGQDAGKNVAAALARFGGMGEFVGKADRVLIKPNMGWNSAPAQAANTHPGVVAALVHACRDAGAQEIWVTDVPVDDAKDSFGRSGIHRAALEAGAKVILPQQSRYIQIPIPGMPGTWPLLELFTQADKIINVPVAKAHSLTSVSAGMKNWFGVLGSQRMMLHTNIDAALAGLTEMMKPTLTVVDAMRVLMRGRPGGGDLGNVKQVGAVAVSVDPVAADAWAATAVGVPVGKVRGLVLAEQRNLGHADLRTVSLVEIVTG